MQEVLWDWYTLHLMFTTRTLEQSQSNDTVTACSTAFNPESSLSVRVTAVGGAVGEEVTYEHTGNTLIAGQYRQTNTVANHVFV